MEYLIFSMVILAVTMLYFGIKLNQVINNQKALKTTVDSQQGLVRDNTTNINAILERLKKFDKKRFLVLPASGMHGDKPEFAFLQEAKVTQQKKISPFDDGGHPADLKVEAKEVIPTGDKQGGGN